LEGLDDKVPASEEKAPPLLSAREFKGMFFDRRYVLVIETDRNESPMIVSEKV
jgi:hypothetical protein